MAFMSTSSYLLLVAPILETTDRLTKNWKWRLVTGKHIFTYNYVVLKPDLGISLDSKLADKELKAVTPEKSKSCATAFIKKFVTTFQL